MRRTKRWRPARRSATVLRRRAAIVPVRAFGLVALLSVSAPLAAIDGVRTDVATFVGMATRGPHDAPRAVSSAAEFAAEFGDFDPSLAQPFLAPSVAAFFDNGGRRCWVVRVAGASDDAVNDAVIDAIDALGAIDEIGLVCAPGFASSRVQNAMLERCAAAGDRIALLDTERDATVSQARDQREQLSSEDGFGALYFPWVIAAVAGADTALPPSGFVAGLMARLDRERGVHAAPTGDLAGVVGLARDISQAEQDLLNPIGVNAIRSFPGAGFRVWGARTLSSASEWRYVNVRRFFLYLEESLQEGTEWAVFEPNDEPLWSRLRREIGDFLIAAWRDGALLGASPDDAFFVRVDRSTMTQADLDAGRTVILVGAATLAPAEFAILRIAHERAAATPPFLRGDANGDGTIDISDASRVLAYLFLGGEALPCLDAADANDEGDLSIAAAVFILQFLFLGGDPPPPPAGACAQDPTDDGLDCGVSAEGCRQ